MLLDKKSSQYLILIVKVAGYFGSVPYQWDSQSRKFYFVDTIFAKSLWLLHNVVYSLYMIYVKIRWVLVSKELGSGSLLAMGTLYVSVLYEHTTAAQVSLLMNYGQHHTFLNLLLEYLENFEKHNQKDVEKVDRKSFDQCHKILHGFAWLMVVVFIFDTASVFDHPHAPYFITSLTSEPKTMTLLEIFPYSCFHMWIWLHEWATCLFYYGCMLCYLTGVKNIMKVLKCRATEPPALPGQLQRRTIQINNRRLQPTEMIVGSQMVVLENMGPLLPAPSSAKGGQMEMVDLEKVEELLYTPIGTNSVAFSEELRKLQILQAYCNKIWATSNALFEISFIGGAVLGIYGSVKQRGFRRLQQASVSLLITGTLMQIWQNMGELYEHCMDMMNGWKIMGTLPWFRKFLRSTRAVRINIGNFFYADRGIRLTILAIIFERTTSLLLSNKDKR